MFERFWKEQNTLLKFTGFIAAVGALFLNISPPQDQNAKLALANLQTFVLILLTIGLTMLFINFIKLLIKTEKSVLGKYDIPSTGLLSSILGIIFLWVILSLWTYILGLYQYSFAVFMEMAFPGITCFACFGLIIWMEKRCDKFTRFSHMMVYSFMITVLLSIVALYLGQTSLFRKYIGLSGNFILVTFFSCLSLSLIGLLFRNKRLFEIPPDAKTYSQKKS